MERVTHMKEVIEEKVDFLICKRLEKLEKLLNSNANKIRNDLETVLEELVSDEEEGSLVISFLRSSYILNSYEFYIAYYKDDLFVDEEPACIYFSMRSVFHGIEEDWCEINEELRKNFIRVFAGEKEEMRRWYMERIYISLESIMERIVEKMQKSRDIDVYYGSYMEDVKAIGHI